LFFLLGFVLFIPMAEDGFTCRAGSTFLSDGFETGNPQRALELVFIDSRVPDRNVLLEDITGHTDRRRRFVIITLDATRNGIEQVSAALRNHTRVDAIHLLTHATAGSLQLGSTELNFDTLQQRSEQIGSWGKALSEDGDILLYGCNLAATQRGRALIETFARLTGADVAASDDKTGPAELGADWELEVKTGTIEAPALVSLPMQAKWHHLLNIYNVTNTNNSGAGSLRQAIIDANGNAGADTITFSIGAVGSVQTISVSSVLPDITGQVTIDGWSQGGAGYQGPPLINLTDTGALTFDGLRLVGAGASGSTVRGFAIYAFGDDGIELRDIDNVTIVGN